MTFTNLWTGAGAVLKVFFGFNGLTYHPPINHPFIHLSIHTSTHIGIHASSCSFWRPMTLLSCIHTFVHTYRLVCTQRKQTHTYVHAHIHTYRQTDRHTYLHMKTGRQNHRQTDTHRLRGRQTQTETETDRHTQTG